MPSGPRIYRIILPVSPIDEIAAFYTRLLGIEGMRVSGGRHYFDCGGVILALYDPAGDGDSLEPRPNIEHVYLAVQELEPYWERARDLGALVDETGDGNLAMGAINTRPWGERSFYARDPFGNPLCFVDQTTVFTG
ncbi:MAG TPA: VOC family protein [Thermoanaerobaculia bacterium]|nr:VOC family protein [Thermoanaerobaculia bacterium]